MNHPRSLQLPLGESLRSCTVVSTFVWYARMQGTQYWLCLSVWLAAVAMLASASCLVSSCDPQDPHLPTAWMNTSLMAAHVRGTSFTLYPMRRNGVAFEEASLSFNMTAVQELQPFVGDIGSCDLATGYSDQSSLISTVLRDLNWTALCCDVKTGWEMMEPTINRTFAIIRATDPLHPDFFFEMEYSIVNESISYRKTGTNNTDNRDYFLDYSYASYASNHPTFQCLWQLTFHFTSLSLATMLPS